jgi:DNA polymerase-3 subunit epsilon
MILKLKRPIAIIDLETTGTAVEFDRIVEIAVLKVKPDGTTLKYEKRVNPGMPIPPEASKVHGIYDKDVKNKPTFHEIADEVARVLKDCDIAGFNVTNFDSKMLQREFQRAKAEFSMEGRLVIDAQRIFHAKEPRDLGAAARFYLKTEHEAAHSALGDAQMCWKVLNAQLERYGDLPRDPPALHEFCNPADDRYLDSGRKFEWRHGQAAFAFGRYGGQLLKDVAQTDRGYLEWMLRTEFPADTLGIASDALNGKFPKRRP